MHGIGSQTLPFRSFCRFSPYSIRLTNLFRFISSMTNICSNYAARNNGYCISPQTNLFRFISSMTNICSNYAARNNGYCISLQTNLFRFISSMTKVCSNYAARNNGYCIRPQKHHPWDFSAIFAIIVSQNNRYAWHWFTNFTFQIFLPFFAIQYSSDKSV